MGEEGQEDEEFSWWVANVRELRIMAECQCVLLDEIDLKSCGGERVYSVIELSLTKALTWRLDPRDSDSTRSGNTQYVFWQVRKKWKNTKGRGVSAVLQEQGCYNMQGHSRLLPVAPSWKGTPRMANYISPQQRLLLLKIIWLAMFWRLQQHVQKPP